MVTMTPSDEQSLLRFTAGADKLCALVGDLSPAGLDASAEPNGWTVRQIVHHLADDCDVWSLCIKKAIATPGAVVRFEGFPGNEAWAEALDFDRRDAAPALELIAAHHHYLAALLEHFPEHWDRSVKFANAEGEMVGEMSVREIAGMLAEHMDEHLATIEQIGTKAV